MTGTVACAQTKHHCIMMASLKRQAYNLTLESQASFHFVYMTLVPASAPFDAKRVARLILDGPLNQKLRTARAAVACRKEGVTK